MWEAKFSQLTVNKYESNKLCVIRIDRMTFICIERNRQKLIHCHFPDKWLNRHCLRTIPTEETIHTEKETCIHRSDEPSSPRANTMKLTFLPRVSSQPHHLIVVSCRLIVAYLKVLHIQIILRKHHDETKQSVQWFTFTISVSQTPSLPGEPVNVSSVNQFLALLALTGFYRIC